MLFLPPQISTVYSYQRQKKLPPSPVTIPLQADRAKEATCPGFDNAFKVLKEGARGWSEKLHQMCIDCNRVNRRKKCQQRPPPQRPPQTPEVNTKDTEPISQIAAVYTMSARYLWFPEDFSTTGTRPLMPPSQNNQQSDLNTPHLLQRVVEKEISYQIILGSQSSYPSFGHAGTAVAPIAPQTYMPKCLQWPILACNRTFGHCPASLSAANHSPISIKGAFHAKFATQFGSG